MTCIEFGIAVAPAVEWPLRVGFVAAPILMSAGFFLGAPMGESKKTGRLIVLLYAGAIVLMLSTLGLGVALLIT